MRGEISAVKHVRSRTEELKRTVLADAEAF